MRKLFALCILLTAFWSAPAFAANTCGTGTGGCYAGGTVTFNASTNWENYACSVGSLPVCSTGAITACAPACTPAAGDTIVADSASGTSITTAVSISIANLDLSGAGNGLSGSPFTGTITFSNATTLTLTGTVFNVPAAATVAANGAFSYATANTLAFTSGCGTNNPCTGHVYGSITVNNASAIFQPQDNLSLGVANNFTLTAGEIDAATHNVNMTVGFLTANVTANTRNVQCGTGTWKFIGSPATNNLIDFATSNPGATLTLNCASAAFIVQSNTPSLTATTILNLSASQSYGAMTFSCGGSAICAAFNTVGAGNTLASLTLTPPITWTPNNNQTITITAAPAWAGTASKPIGILNSGINSNNVATVTITNAGGTATWMAFQGITVTGNAPTVTNSFDLGHNSGLSIGAPAAGSGVPSIIGG